jgi:hypothetical protein
MVLCLIKVRDFIFTGGNRYLKVREFFNSRVCKNNISDLIYFHWSYACEILYGDNHDYDFKDYVDTFFVS